MFISCSFEALCRRKHPSVAVLHTASQGSWLLSANAPPSPEAPGVSLAEGSLWSGHTCFSVHWQGCHKSPTHSALARASDKAPLNCKGSGRENSREFHAIFVEHPLSAPLSPGVPIFCCSKNAFSFSRNVEKEKKKSTYLTLFPYFSSNQLSNAPT